jgi:transcriptional regulator with XRE-family HTH domain
MAAELGISPSAYNKIERMESKLSLERFLQIKRILDKDYSDFFNIKSDKIFNQTINDQAYGNIEHFYHDNKEVYEKLIVAKDEQIALLKSLLEK